MAYDEKYRKRTIDYLQEGHTYRETSTVFNVSPNTISLRIKQYKETGNCKKKTRLYSSKLNYTALQVYLNTEADGYQREMAEELHCSVSTINRALRRLGITRKKRPNATKNKPQKK